MVRRTVAGFGGKVLLALALLIASPPPATAQQLCQSDTLCIHDQMPIWDGWEVLDYLNTHVPPYDFAYPGGWCGGEAAAMLLKSYARELAQAGTPISGTYSWLNSADPGVVLFSTFNLVGTDIVGGNTWFIGGTGPTVWSGYNAVFSDAYRNASSACYDYLLGGWGCTLSEPVPTVYDFRNAYQRPLVHLVVGTRLGTTDHHLVVNGTEGNNLYKILDPWSGDIYDVTVSGNTMTWAGGDQSGRLWSTDPRYPVLDHSLTISFSGILWDYGASSRTLTPPTIDIPVDGWNLVGNGYRGTIDLMTGTTALSDPNKVVSVWKWLSDQGNWAVYYPGLPDRGADYAGAHGYDLLTSLTAGDGFWVNARGTPYSVELPWSAPVSSHSYRSLARSLYHLVAIGENGGVPLTAPGLEQSIGAYNAVWTWDPWARAWYFYAPSLAAQGGPALSDYITTRGYLDFGGSILTPTTGLWIKK